MKKVLTFIFILLAVLGADFAKESPPPKRAEGEALHLHLAENLKRALLQAIKGAKEEIVLLIYTLKDRDIIQLLNKKAEEGVRVKILFDAKASEGVQGKLSKKIQAFARSSLGLMHLKLLVIDEKVSYLSSANFTDDSLTRQNNLMVEVDSNKLAETILEKFRRMTEGNYEAPIPPLQLKTKGVQLEFSFLPDDKDGVQKIKQLIRGAKKTIKVALYTFTREDFADQLIRAKKRGVDVQVVTDQSTANGASKKIVALLEKGGIQPILYSNGTLMHHKLMWIDSEILVHGSANWTKAAFSQNDDYFMIASDLTPSQKVVMYDLFRPFESSP